MKALVVYDSEFRNTAEVARTMAETLACEARRVTEVTPEDLEGLDALIVGSPTQGFQPLEPIKAFLKDLPKDALKGVRVAAFDTRMDVEKIDSRILRALVKVFGYAAKPMGARLVKKGGIQALPPEGFVVEDKEGPLREGELERAAAWARRLLSATP
ncbi:MAG: flavodoxin family protein [Anaerolineae bacterium]